MSGKLDFLKSDDDNKSRWRVYAVVVLVVLIPCGLLFGIMCPFIYAGQISGELIDIDTIIQNQRNSDDEYLIGMAYSYPDQYLKKENTNYYKPDLLALGTSRVMQFKNEEFVVSFYNAGGGISNIDQYYSFIKNINQEALPDVIIVGLDQYFFNDNWNGNLIDDYYQFKKPNELNVKNIFGQMFIDYLNKKWNFTILESPICEFNSGFSAIFKNAGFMKDGSYYYGYIYENPSSSTDYQFKDTFQRIQDGNLRFEYAKNIDDSALNCLDNFLNLCQDNNITVIGFIPPFAPSVIDMMNDSGDNYAYINKIGPSCKNIFDQYGFELYDYTDIRHLCCDDSYFIDGFHGSEVAYLLMLIDMVTNDSLLKNYVSETNLNELYKNRHSNLTLHSLEWWGEYS